MKPAQTEIRPFRFRSIIQPAVLIYVAISASWLTISHVLPGLFYSDLQKRFQLELILNVVLIFFTAIALGLFGKHVLTTIRKQQKEFYGMLKVVSAARGEDFFPVLLRSLTETLAADYAFVARFTEKSRCRLKTVAVFGHGQLGGDFNYDLKGTPCEKILRQGMACYPENVRRHFPLDPLIVELDVDHYTGIALSDCDGRVQGVMAIAGKGPLRNRQLAESLLELFAVRAAAALEGMIGKEAVDYLALHDSLTGLPNRRMFTERLAPLLSSAQQHAEIHGVLLLDLDRFKNINDSLGHAVGDHLLKAVASRLTRCLRHTDMVARLGGDEFMILLKGLTEERDALTVGVKVLDSLRPPFKIQEHQLHVASSIGIAIFPKHGQDVDTLLKNADTAMNRAKDLGRNTCQVFSPEMSTLAMTRLDLENDLRRALERDELLLHFQPQYTMDDKVITGVEALLRWQHPDRGLLLPGDFIATAEETGLIVPIGKWAIREACEQSRRWRKAGMPPLRMAVNLSAKQFQQQDLPDVVTGIIHETAIDPAYLELEITESILMQNLETTVDQLIRLMALGVKISIDDFGTGYSSLNYLKRFPLHALKIDQSFVRDIGEDSDDTSIVGAIIALAHNLCLEVVAEGVETAAQMEFLHSRQCDRCQGFLLSPPVPAESIQRMFLPENLPEKAVALAKTASSVQGNPILRSSLAR